MPPQVLRDIEDVARRQSRALVEATTTVHRAFHYRHGGPRASSKDLKFVAVDVEFKGHNRDLDLDDVDIVDGETGENYGSDPEIRLLRPDGSFEQNNAKWETEGDSLRVLLIYAVPERTESIKLEYWGGSLTPKPTRIGEGQVRYSEGQMIDGIEFWSYPVLTHYDGAWQRGRWLIVSLSAGRGAAVVDLHAWPPKIHHWDCNLLRAIEPAPNGGWIVITRIGHTRDDIRFPVWLHPKDKPGDSSLRGQAVSPGEHLEGIAVVGQQCFVYDDRVLYRFANGKIDRVEEVDEAKGINGNFGIKYTHGQISLGDGSRFMLWDGDAYALVDGRLKTVWRLGINEPYEFVTVPWGRDGFYFIEDRVVYRVKPGTPRERVMSAAENVMGIREGPDGSILFNLGDNDPGYISVIWFPDEDTYIPVRIGEISEKLTTTEVDTVHWSQATRRFYFVARRGIFTVSGEQILRRSRETLATE